MSDADCTPDREPRSVAASLSLSLRTNSVWLITDTYNISLSCSKITTVALNRTRDSLIAYFEFT